jgi:hypothetical protein
MESVVTAASMTIFGTSILMSVDAKKKLNCLEREIRMRIKVYPRWVAENKMDAAQAQYEIECMESIAADYRAIVERDEPKLL